MSEKRRPGRPKSDDPKTAVTLRPRRSLIAAYQAKGANWRALMEAALAAGVSSANPEQITKTLKAKAKPAAPAVSAETATHPSKLDLPVFGSFERKPMQKTGKR